MTLQLIAGIVGTAVCFAGVASDAVTSQLAMRKGSVEANPELVKLHITTPTRLLAFAAGVTGLCAVLSLFVPYVGATFAVGVGVAGLIQTVKNIRIL